VSLSSRLDHVAANSPSALQVSEPSNTTPLRTDVRQMLLAINNARMLIHSLLDKPGHVRLGIAERTTALFSEYDTRYTLRLSCLPMPYVSDRSALSLHQYAYVTAAALIDLVSAGHEPDLIRILKQLFRQLCAMSEPWLVACEALYALRRKIQSRIVDPGAQQDLNLVTFLDGLIDKEGGPGSGQDELVRDLFSELFADGQDL